MTTTLYFPWGATQAMCPRPLDLSLISWHFIPLATVIWLRMNRWWIRNHSSILRLLQNYLGSRFYLLLDGASRRSELWAARLPSRSPGLKSEWHTVGLRGAEKLKCWATSSVWTAPPLTFSAKYPSTSPFHLIAHLSWASSLPATNGARTNTP